jgi:hypothetical protein
VSTTSLWTDYPLRIVQYCEYYLPVDGLPLAYSAVLTTAGLACSLAPTAHCGLLRSTHVRHSLPPSLRSTHRWPQRSVLRLTLRSVALHGFWCTAAGKLGAAGLVGPPGAVGLRGDAGNVGLRGPTGNAMLKLGYSEYSRGVLGVLTRGTRSTHTGNVGLPGPTGTRAVRAVG